MVEVDAKEGNTENNIKRSFDVRVVWALWAFASWTFRA